MAFGYVFFPNKGARTATSGSLVPNGFAKGYAFGAANWHDEDMVRALTPSVIKQDTGSGPLCHKRVTPFIGKVNRLCSQQ